MCMQTILFSGQLPFPCTSSASSRTWNPDSATLRVQAASQNSAVDDAWDASTEGDEVYVPQQWLWRHEKLLPRAHRTRSGMPAWAERTIGFCWAWQRRILIIASNIMFDMHFSSAVDIVLVLVCLVQCAF
jgi:hypothetical protein